MKISRPQLKQMIKEAASEYVWGVKNPGRVANKYKISVLKQVIMEELQVVLTNEEAGEMFGEELEELLNEKDEELNEKAVSKKQQRFMGMVRATQKGESESPPPEVKKVAKSMKKKDVEDFASTKHKGLPEKKKEKK